MRVAIITVLPQSGSNEVISVHVNTVTVRRKMKVAFNPKNRQMHTQVQVFLCVNCCCRGESIQYSDQVKLTIPHCTSIPKIPLKALHSKFHCSKSKQAYVE